MLDYSIKGMVVVWVKNGIVVEKNLCIFRVEIIGIVRIKLEIWFLGIFDGLL